MISCTAEQAALNIRNRKAMLMAKPTIVLIIDHTPHKEEPALGHKHSTSNSDSRCIKKRLPRKAAASVVLFEKLTRGR